MQPLSLWQPPLDAGEAKLAELVLYISDRCSDDETFGATKLNKILHAADFLAYATFGKAITGVDYFHLPQGPGPRRFVPVREHLIETHRLAIQERTRFGFKQSRPIALEEADLSSFEAREIALVDEIIKILDGKSATAVSEGSHVNRFSLGWQLTHDREVIPYDTVFVSAMRPTADEYAKARGLAETRGWLASS